MWPFSPFPTSGDSLAASLVSRPLHGGGRTSRNYTFSIWSIWRDSSIVVASNSVPSIPTLKHCAQRSMRECVFPWQMAAQSSQVRLSRHGSSRADNTPSPLDGDTPLEALQGGVGLPISQPASPLPARPPVQTFEPSTQNPPPHTLNTKP